MLYLAILCVGFVLLWGAADVIIGVFQMAWGLGILLVATWRWLFGS